MSLASAMRRLRRGALLLAVLASAAQAVHAAAVWAAPASWPADYCVAPSGAQGDGPGQAHDGAGGCPCCRAQPLIVCEPPRAAIAAQAEGHDAPPRLAASAVQFDPLLEWRSVLSQGPPAIG